MCGIVGTIQAITDVKVSRVQVELRRGMLALAHRGPDGRGEYCETVPRSPFVSEIALGHLRLSIIDLSNLGAQPMAGLDGQLVIVFNGEIYNYVELREELRDVWKFRSQTDTEVLLAAYAVWGLQMLERLDGMFAFALWDRRISTLIVARDPQGIKPLYYTVGNGAFRFASEPGALLAMVGGRPRANWDTIGRFLAVASSDGDRATFFQDIQQLRPGECATISADGCLTWQYQYWNSIPKRLLSVPTPGEIRNVLRTSVRRQLRSDVKIGFSLSGGVDSCVLLGLAADLKEFDPTQYEALTVSSSDFKDDEGPLARLMASSVGVKHHIISLLEGSPIADFREMVRISGEPFTTLSMFGQFLLMKRARAEGIKVIIGGQGGDELFLGYPRLGYWMVRELLLSGRIREAYNLAVRFRQNTGAASDLFLRAHLEYRSRALRLGKIALQFATLVSPSLLLTAARASLAQERYTTLEHCEEAEFSAAVLPRLLRYEDRNGMAFGVESRVPLLGAEVVALMQPVLSREKMAGMWSKSLLRRAAGGLVPKRILWETPKRGFIIPQGRLAQRLRPVIAEALFESGAKKCLNGAAILKALDNPNKADWHSLWRCISIALWAKEYDVNLAD